MAFAIIVDPRFLTLDTLLVTSNFTLIRALCYAMSHSQLLVTSLLEYAARCHSDQQVLSYNENGLLQRGTYRDMHKRAQLCASALKAMGVRSVITANWHVSPFADRAERPASWSSDACVLHEFECAAVKAARSQPLPLTAANTWSVGKKSQF